jgi:tRNA(Ile)-lysidine synthase TilS/MesJ
MHSLCSRCVLPSNFPGIRFNADGVCNFCEEHEHVQIAVGPHAAREREEMHMLMDSIRGRRTFDALCCYSGGKDSTFMLRRMVKDYRLNVLAYTLDNGFIAEQAKRNIATVIDKLDVSHVYVRPKRGFLRRMYRTAMFGSLNQKRGHYKTRISDVCLSCISLVNAQAVRLAIQNDIPTIFTGFTPGQVPRAIIENPHTHYIETYRRHRAHYLANLGSEADCYFDIKGNVSELYQISPFVVDQVDEAEVIATIRAEGWIEPENLDGCTSNCQLNALGNQCHQRRYGFHPYADELSKLIRSGLLNRKDGLEKLHKTASVEVRNAVIQRLDLSADEASML